MNVSKQAIQQALTANPRATQAQLADMFETTAKRVGALMRQYGLKTVYTQGCMLRIPRADLEAALRKYPGMSLRDLGGLFGVSHDTAMRSLRECGLQVDRSRVSKKRIQTAHAKGATTPEKMAEALGVTVDEVVHWMDYLDLTPGTNGRGAIRHTLPACRVCSDPVSDDPVWGGEGDVHFLCAAHEGRRGTIVYDKWSGEND